MCLEITATLTTRPPKRAKEIARTLTSDGPLHAALVRPSGRNPAPTLRLYEPGHGCACSMLSDEADWNATTWAMLPDALRRLADALAAVDSAARGPWEFQARWLDGSKVSEVDITSRELLHLVRRGQIATRSRYKVAG